MAKQGGHLPLIGKLGNLVYYSYKGTPVVRMDGSKSAEYYKKAPEMARFRENGWEFGRGAKTKAFIKRAFAPLLFQVKDGDMDQRLNMTVNDLLFKDNVSERGKRRLTGENLKLLKGFEFNKKALMRKIIQFEYESSIDKESGIMRVFIKPFVPKETIKAPVGSTHFRLVAGGACLDLEKLESESDFKQSNTWGVDTDDAIAIELTMGMPMKVEGSMMLVFGIQFSDDDNGLPDWKSYKEKNGLKVVEVSLIP